MIAPKKKKKPFLERKAEIHKKYNVHVSAYGGYANEKREKPIVEIIEKAAKYTGLKPSYLFTIAVGEGLSLYLEKVYNYDKNDLLITNVSIDGFYYLGLDFFSSPKEYPRFKKYLPRDYNEGDEYIPYLAERNEKNGKEMVPSAKFYDLESAIEGIAAVLKHRQELFLRKNRMLGYKKPTDDQLAYWTYVFYQAEGDAKRKLQRAGSLDIFQYKETSRKTAHIKALERLASWRYILHYNIFSE